MKLVLTAALMAAISLGDAPEVPSVPVGQDVPTTPEELKEFLDLMELLDDFGPLVDPAAPDQPVETDEQSVVPTEPNAPSPVGNDSEAEHDDGS